ncbi:MAG: helix-turn-helix domain-containing protein [Chloroflexota bacterium]
MQIGYLINASLVCSKPIFKLPSALCNTMFKIGDFAKLAHVSTFRLRNYDKEGLLTPKYTDQDTGYRYYSVEQLGRLNKILALRELGLSLEAIKEALIANIDTKQMEQILLHRQTQIKEEIARREDQLYQVQKRLEQIREECKAPSFEIVVKSLPAYPIASIKIPTVQKDELSFYCKALHPEIHEALNKSGIKAKWPTINLYYFREYVDTDIEFEACVTVKPEAANSASQSRVNFRLLKGEAKAATLLLSEGFGRFEEAVLSLEQWIITKGYQIVGPTREVHYAPFVNEVKSQKGDHIVELQVPIEKRCS